MTLMFLASVLPFRFPLLNLCLWSGNDPFRKLLKTLEWCFSFCLRWRHFQHYSFRSLSVKNGLNHCRAPLASGVTLKRTRLRSVAGQNCWRYSTTTTKSAETVFWSGNAINCCGEKSALSPALSVPLPPPYRSSTRINELLRSVTSLSTAVVTSPIVIVRYPLLVNVNGTESGLSVEP